MDIPYRAQGAVLNTEDGALSVGWLNWYFQVPGNQFYEFSANDDVYFIHIITACHVTAKRREGLIHKISPRLKTCSSKYPTRERLWQKLVLSLDESFSDWIFITFCNYTLTSYKLENRFSG
jgi:hypothetical protein